MVKVFAWFISFTCARLWVGSHFQKSIFRLTGDIHSIGNVVGCQRRHSDTQIHIHAVLELHRGAFDDALAFLVDFHRSRVPRHCQLFDPLLISERPSTCANARGIVDRGKETKGRRREEKRRKEMTCQEVLNADMRSDVRGHTSGMIPVKDPNAAPHTSKKKARSAPSTYLSCWTMRCT